MATLPTQHLDRRIARHTFANTFPLGFGSNQWMFVPRDRLTGGFDAIVQLRGDAVNHHVRKSFPRVTTGVAAGRLSGPAQAELQAIADANAERSHLYVDGLGLVPVTITFDAITVEFDFEFQRVDMELGSAPITAMIHGRVIVRLVLRESHDSWAVRRAEPRRFGSPGPERREIKVEYARWDVRRPTRCTVMRNTDLGRFWLATNYDGDAHTAAAGDVETELAATDAAREIWGASARAPSLTPTFSLFQDRSYAGVAGADQLRVEAKVTRLTADIHPTLHLCVSLRSTAGAELGAVQLLHEGSSFGYFAATHVVTEAMRLGWEAADVSSPVATTVPIALEVSDRRHGRTRVEGSLDIEVTLLRARDYHLRTSLIVDDHPMFWVDAEVNAIELRDHLGTIIPFEGVFFERLQDPAEFLIPVQLRIFEEDFDTGELPTTAIGRGIRRMLNMMLLPLARTDRSRLRVHDGRFSQPLAAMIVTGELV